MARFTFEAKGANGQNYHGDIEASNEAEARVKLRAQRLTPLKVVPKSSGFGGIGGARKARSGGKVKPKDLQIFTRQLSTLLQAGIPILQSLDSLARGTRAPVLKAAVADIMLNVQKGKRFADALQDHPNVFDKFFQNMIRAGEETGGLDQILNRLAIYIEKSVKIQSKVKGALVYPVAILGVALLVVSAILIFVIPKFKELFESSGQELPGITVFVMNMSSFMMTYWYLIIGGLVGAFYGFKAYAKTPAGSAQIDDILLKAPVIGDIVQKGAIARFTRTLGTLLASGVGIMEALEISSKTVSNNTIEKAILRAKIAIQEGKSITVPLSKEKYIPAMVTQMISVGEQTGNLDSMLSKIADFYEDEVDAAVGAMTSLMEPLLMVFLGGMVGFLVIAMYLPIFKLASGVG